MRKGFTLIELLAVILILGIITLIAIPIINDIINDSKKETAKNSAIGIIKSAENSYAIDLIKKQTGEKEFSCNGDKCVLSKINNHSYNGIEVKLEFNGIVPKSGIVTLSDEGNAHIKNLDIDDYICYENKDDIICKKKSEINKLFYLDIPFKEDMMYYYDFKEISNGKIDNYGDGKERLNIVNATLNDDAIYFTGENKSYAYTEKNLNNHDYFTMYFVSKFDNVYSNNYLISTTSNNSTNLFGLGIGRYGTGTNGSNVVINMVTNVDNNFHTEYDILNYYVYAIVYNKGNVNFYINGNLTSSMNDCNSTSKIYFASYNNKNTIYGGSLVRYKHFSFVDAIHTDEEVKANSDWLYNKFLND